MIKPRDLKVIYINPAGGCNLHCRHCWVNEGGTASETMSLKSWTALLDEAVVMGCSSIKYTGGEPLLYPEFVELYRYSGNLFQTVMIETNGTLRPKGFFEALEDFPPLQVSVSLDSAKEESHDQFRGKKGAWRNSVFFIEELVSRGLNNQVIMSVSVMERQPVLDMIALIERIGAGSLKINFITPVGRGAKDSFYEDLDIKEALEYFRWLTTETPQWVLPSLPAALVPADRLAGVGYCPVRNLIGVLPDGTFSLCGVAFSRPEMAWGRYPEVSLSDAWARSPVLTEIRNKLPDDLEYPCSMCIHKTSCIGRCIVNNYETSGSLFASDLFCKKAMNEGLFPETRLIRSE
ncbi:MAG TPA: radical SAM protein [Candidatus Sabulitectum sp.]|nr:radical SAM protein [Candidatus Sabulitectum sp.]HPJ28111.1 radical SAM protein [Candidatus Sabulitectum sp.]HPR22089.1 radical SAM protein [Candidatus Sabulitectum sp.]